MARMLLATTVVQLSLMLGTASAFQATWTVDDNGGADFIHIQDAVDAAQSGDVIVVWDGAYAGFAVDGKSLVVVAEPGGDVQVAAQVSVSNLVAGQKVELDGLHIGVTFLDAGPTVVVEDNTGSVRIVDCEIVGRGVGNYSQLDHGEAMQCSACDYVGILRSSLQGESGWVNSEYYWGTGGYEALVLDQTNVTITDSTIVGGDGGDGHPLYGSCGYFGGYGVQATSSTIVSFGSDFLGGRLGDGLQMCSSRNSALRFLGGTTGSWKATTLNGQEPVPGSAFARTEIASFCLGTFEECPCGNNGAAGAGCETSYNSGGVVLSAAGDPSVSTDTLTLNATGLRPTATPTGLFFQGDNQANGGLGTPFNDGLLCTNAGIVRLKGKLATNGSVSFGFGIPSDAPVSVRGQIPPAGGTRTYQLWFRHAAPQFCSPERFHMSNAVEITWLP
jgi:hypothetical protein